MDINKIAVQEARVKSLGESCTEEYYEKGEVSEDTHLQYLSARTELEKMKGNPSSHRKIAAMLFEFLLSDNWEVFQNHVVKEFNIGDMEAALEFDLQHIVISRGDSTNMIGLIKLYHRSDAEPVDEGIEVLYSEYQLQLPIEKQLMFCVRQILKRYINKADKS